MENDDVDRLTHGRRLEADARRDEILRSAVRLFGDRPYGAVTTTDLAEAAGVTRGLIHHYFGTKRELYLEVVRAMVLVPNLDESVDPGSDMEERVSRSVDWFLDSVATHGSTYMAVTGTAGDAEVEQILATADDIAARKVLRAVGVDVGEGEQAPQRAVVRAYCQLAKAAVREWLQAEALTRDQAHLLLARSLLALVADVLPDVCAEGDARRPRAASADHVADEAGDEVGEFVRVDE